MHRENGLVIGDNALTGKPVYLSLDELMRHFHILGTTGSGKSFLMEHVIRCLIRLGQGLCLIDPHGGLFNSVLKYVTLKRMENRVIIIDPNDDDWAVGLNCLEYDQGVRSSTSHASVVMDGISKVFGGANMDVMPRLQRWGRNALIPLIEKRLTVVELSQFVDPESSSIRRLILQQVENYEVIDEWKRFDQVPRRDRESYVEAVYNRANKFCASNNIRRIFGQEKSTIDFRKAMDEGKIILCNLASNKLSREEQDMLGVVICDKIVQAAKSRVDIPERRRRPFFFFLDEFGQYASEDIAIALQELRKFKVSFVLAHQELQQLEEDSRKLYSAVISEPQLKIAFRISRKDAEIMVGEFFTGKIRGDKEKRRIEQTKFWPKESTRVVEGDSDSWSEVESETKTGSSLDITRGESSIYAGGHTRSVVPFYEQIPFMEVSNINDYSIEEITEKFIAWLMNQPDRHAQMKVKQNPPIPIITPYVEQFQVRETDIMALKEKVYSRYALPAKEVDRMIEDRRNRFISEADGQGSLDRPNPAPALTPESMRHSIQSSGINTREHETVIRKEMTNDDEDD